MVCFLRLTGAKKYIATIPKEESMLRESCTALKRKQMYGLSTQSQKVYRYTSKGSVDVVRILHRLEKKTNVCTPYSEPAE